jgi:exopolysaccharide production protein ExoZ
MAMIACKDRLQRWYETDSSEKRILSMEGLRGLAITLVFICHFQIVVLERLSSSFHSKFYLVVAQLGGTGVDLFFLLSGMLIYRAAMKPGLHYGRFLLRRVQRIYPTFIVVLILYMVFSMFLHIGEHYRVAGFKSETAYLLENVFLLPGIVDLPPVISAAWSLSYEFIFYLTIPILVRVLVLRRWSRDQRATFWAVLILSYLGLVWMKPGLLPRYQYQDGSFVRFTLFLAGMIIEEALISDRVQRMLESKVQWGLLLISGAAAAALFVSEWRTVGTAGHDSKEHAVVRAFLVLIIYVGLALTALNANGLLTRLFNRALARWTGNISYSFYLIHGFTLNVLGAVIVHLAWVRQHASVAVAPLFALACMSTFAAATLLFLSVEKPYSLRPGASRRLRTMPIREEALAGKPQEV